MSTYQSLSRHARNMIESLQEYADTNAPMQEDVLSTMQTLQHVFPQWVLTTCPVHHPDIRFITANCHAVFGYSPELLTRQNFTFFSYIVEDDLQELQKGFAFIDDFLKNSPPETYSSLRCVFHYRFMHGDGRVIVVRDEKAAMRLQDNSSLYYSVLKDVTDETKYSGVKIEMFKKAATLEKLAEYRPSAGKNKLSKRENELITLLQHGLTTKEMAHHLGISPHTVRNIRQKMFEKYKVNNAIELLNRTAYSTN